MFSSVIGCRKQNTTHTAHFKVPSLLDAHLNCLSLPANTYFLSLKWSPHRGCTRNTEHKSTDGAFTTLDPWITSWFRSGNFPIPCFLSKQNNKTCLVLLPYCLKNRAQEGWTAWSTHFLCKYSSVSLISTPFLYYYYYFIFSHCTWLVLNSKNSHLEGFLSDCTASVILPQRGQIFHVLSLQRDERKISYWYLTLLLAVYFPGWCQVSCNIMLPLCSAYIISFLCIQITKLSKGNMQYRCRSFASHVQRNKPAPWPSSSASGVRSTEPILSKCGYKEYFVDINVTI